MISALYKKLREKYEKGDNISQLRHDIDSGRTGDKTSVVDPAAAPLGTDEEAAGTPLDPQVVKETRQQELKRGNKVNPNPRPQCDPMD